MVANGWLYTRRCVRPRAGAHGRIRRAFAQPVQPGRAQRTVAGFDSGCGWHRFGDPLSQRTVGACSQPTQKAVLTCGVSRFQIVWWEDWFHAQQKRTTSLSTQKRRDPKVPPLAPIVAMSSGAAAPIGARTSPAYAPARHAIPHRPGLGQKPIPRSLPRRLHPWSFLSHPCFLGLCDRAMSWRAAPPALSRSNHVVADRPLYPTELPGQT